MSTPPPRSTPSVWTTASAVYIVFAMCAVAFGGQFIVQPGPDESKDIWTTSCYPNGTNNDRTANGVTDERLWVGGWGDYYYTYIRFDLSSLPTHANSAYVQFFSYRGPHARFSNVAMFLDRIDQDWDYDHARGILRWTDRPTGINLRVIEAPKVDAWYSIDITDLYNQWQTGTHPNNGIGLRPKGNWDQFNYFWSSRYTNSALRPRLVVTSDSALSPRILRQPTNQTAEAGTPVTFSVNATGDTPLTHQLRFKGQNIGGTTMRVPHEAAENRRRFARQQASAMPTRPVLQQRNVLTQGDYTFTTNASGEASITGFNKNYTGALSITNTLGGCLVTSIGRGAFLECHGLTNVTIPASITRINEMAFGGCCGLNRITIPNRITDIGESMFNGCTNLVSVTIPASVTTICKRAFLGCISLRTFYVDANNMSYASADGVVFNKDKTSIILYPNGKAGSYTIPDSVTNVGFWAFDNCLYLTAIDVGLANPYYSSADGVLFNKSKTTLIRFPCGKGDCYTLPSSVINIETYAFSSCNNLTNVTLPQGIKRIGESAFRNCERLADVTVPDSVTNIGNWAFSGCDGLASITIPDNIARIGDGVVNDCTNLPTSIRAHYDRPPSSVLSRPRFRPGLGSQAQTLAQGDYTFTTNAAGQATITGLNRNYAGALFMTNSLEGVPLLEYLRSRAVPIFSASRFRPASKTLEEMRSGAAST